MKRAARIFLALLAVGSAEAIPPQLVIRAAQPAAPVELRGGNLTFVLPEGTMSKSLNGAWLGRRTGQDATLTYALAPEAGLSLRYASGIRAEDAFSYGPTPMRTQFVGLTQRPALVAQFTEKTSLEAALESQARFDQATRAETAQRLELVLQTTEIGGLTFSAKIGRAAATDVLGVTRDQDYLTLFAEQKLPILPLRISLAPSIGTQDTRDVADSRRDLLGGSTALLLDATANTTLSLNAARYDTNLPGGGADGSFRSYSGQIEQREGKATVHLRAGYEEQWAQAAMTTAAVFLGADSSFSITDSLTGGFQLRQRAVQFLDAAGSLPETILSFSVSGGF